MNAPGCYVIHPGHRAPPEPARTRLRAWLTANGVDPDRVPLTEPVIVLTVPAARHPHTAGNEGADGWWLQVIWFSEHYISPDGLREPNLLTNEVVMFPRTVPLVVPYPTTEEDTDGSTQEVQPVEEGQRPPQHQDGPEGDEQQELRLATQEEVPHRRSASRQKRTGEGGAARIAGGEKAGPQGGRGQVPEPQEEADRKPAPQEEVDAYRELMDLATGRGPRPQEEVEEGEGR